MYKLYKGECYYDIRKVLKEPEPFARLTKHGDSCLEYTVRVWCNASDYWDVNFDLIETVKKEFDANKISIPYSH